MEFDLSETQKLFQRSARELFAQECPPQAVREAIESGNPYDQSLWDKLVEQGWTGLILSEEDGGIGLGMVEMAIAFEEMGRALVPGPFLSTVALAGPLIERAGSKDHRARYLGAISNGEAKATVALLEERASWDPDRVSIVAKESGSNIKVSGRKLFVPDADAADFIIVVARAASDLLLAVVGRDSSGLTIKPMPSIDGTRHLYEVALENVEVAANEVLARGNNAREAINHALDVAALAASAEMVGAMQWMLEATVEYAKTRKQFGKPIGQFQAVQHHCSNMLMMTESARSAVYYAAWVMGNDPKQAPVAVSMAKAYASDGCREVGNLGIQVHGGIGFTWDENIHFYYKRAKASELMFGDATYHRERIAAIIIDHADQPTKAAGITGD